MSTQERCIQEKKILWNPYLKEQERKGIKVSEWLIQNGMDTV
jgi:hypothetical protein